MAPDAVIASLLALCVLAVVASANQGSCKAHGRCADKVSAETPVNLLQIATKTKSGAARTTPTAAPTKTADSIKEEAIKADTKNAHNKCTTLANKGSWFGVSVGVGVPERKFELVADTGSNALVVEDCACQTDGGGCPLRNRCFNPAKSFSFDAQVELVPKPPYVELNGAIMSYGSGSIVVIIGSDVANVGGINTYMSNGVMLMVNRQELKVGPNFEGILGLGLPKSSLHMPQFAVQSHLHRFTLCMSMEGGALRLNTSEPLPNQMENIGVVHWGLGFLGMSVGNMPKPDGPAEVLFCSKEDKFSGEDTPCAAIPDSGTTLMLGPQPQLLKLFGSLCKHWPRCAALAKSTKMDPVSAFHQLLSTCEAWLPGTKLGIEEIPSIFFRVAGAEGKMKTFELAPKNYIGMSTREILEIIVGQYKGMPFRFEIPITAVRVCIPMFSPNHYNTIKNGPVWIFGSPIFFQFTVGYDLNYNKGAGAISLDTRPCVQCNSLESSPLSGGDGPFSVGDGDGDSSGSGDGIPAAGDGDGHRNPLVSGGGVGRYGLRVITDLRGHDFAKDGSPL